MKVATQKKYGFEAGKSSALRVPWYDEAFAFWSERLSDPVAVECVMNSLEGSTARNYGGIWKEFVRDFCQPRGLQPFPCSQDTILKYIGWQATKGTVASKSLENYLSAIGCRHTDFDLPSPCTGSMNHKPDAYAPAVRRALTGLAKAQKRGVDPDALVEYKQYLPADVACMALDRAVSTKIRLAGNPVNLLYDRPRVEQFRGDLFLAFNFMDFGRGDSHSSMKVTDVDVTPGGDLRFTFAKDKVGSTRLQPRDFFWPASSLPELIDLVDFWLKARGLMESLPGNSDHMWRLPWEPKRFTTEHLRSVFSNTLSSLNVHPPAGRKWTLHCVRSGAASAANAMHISMPVIRRLGGWSRKSEVPRDRYIDPACPHTSSGRRFFAWLHSRLPSSPAPDGVP